jgi:hypothetical protein
VWQRDWPPKLRTTTKGSWQFFRCWNEREAMKIKMLKSQFAFEKGKIYNATSYGDFYLAVNGPTMREVEKCNAEVVVEDNHCSV